MVCGIADIRLTATYILWVPGKNSCCTLGYVQYILYCVRNSLSARRGNLGTRLP